MIQTYYKFLVPLLLAGCTAGAFVIVCHLNRTTQLEAVDRLLLDEAASTLESLRHSVARLPFEEFDDELSSQQSTGPLSRESVRIDVVSPQGKIVSSTETRRIGTFWPDAEGTTARSKLTIFASTNPQVAINPATGDIAGFIRLNARPDAETRSVFDGPFIHYHRNAGALRQKAIHNMDNTFLLEVTMILILMVMTRLLFQIGLSRRVSQLSSSLKQFKKGDWTARSRLVGRDAVADISQCIDRLLDKVISERSALGYSEAKIKAVLETATDGIISIDSRGLVESMNSAAEHMFGYTKEQVIGQNISILMPEPFSDEHNHYIKNYLNTGQAKIIGIGREVAGRRSDGTVFPIELAVSELKFGDERSFTGIVRDISSRKWTEEQLRLSEKQLHLTFENAPIGIVTSDLNCRILNANRACTKIVGYARRELLTKRFTDLVHPDDRSHCLKSAQKAKLDPLESVTTQQRWTHKNGSVVSGTLHIGVIRNPENLPEMFVIQMEDNTDQLNAEAEARQLRDRIAHVARITTLGEMVAGIAHEINQPLAAITNYTDASKRLLASGTADTEALMHAMKQASAQAHRAAKVLQRLRDFSKLRSTPREKVELNALITDVVSLANMENPNLRSTIKLELEKDLPQLQADPVQIQQVILNLIRNGVDAMQECGTQDQNLIIRTVNEGGDSIRIEVVDRGPGVDEKVSDDIFDPFFSTKFSGMGLGLSICRSIARAHGGQLEFTNNTDNGATFFLRLPTMRN